MSESWLDKNKFAVLLSGLFFSFIVFGVSMFSRNRIAIEVMAVITIAFALAVVIYSFTQRKITNDTKKEKNKEEE